MSKFAHIDREKQKKGGIIFKNNDTNGTNNSCYVPYTALKLNDASIFAKSNQCLSIKYFVVVEDNLRPIFLDNIT